MYLQLRQCGICKQASFDPVFLLGELRHPVDGSIYHFCEECFDSLMTIRGDMFELLPLMARPTRLRQ